MEDNQVKIDGKAVSAVIEGGNKQMPEKQKIVTLSSGKQFTLQKPGAIWYMKNMDHCTNNFGVLEKFKYIESLFKNCVLEHPSLSEFDDNITELEELAAEVESFLRNK